MDTRDVPSVSKTNSNFILTKFGEMCTLVVLIILGSLVLLVSARRNSHFTYFELHTLHKTQQCYLLTTLYIGIG